MNTPVDITIAPDGTVTSSLPATPPTPNIDPLPSHDDESDMVISYTSPPTRNYKRTAVITTVILVIAIIALSTGLSSNSNNSNNATTLAQQQKAPEKAQPAPTPVKPPKKAIVAMERSLFPTEEGTTTVSSEVTAPPTVVGRIESPTWRG